VQILTAAMTWQATDIHTKWMIIFCGFLEQLSSTCWIHDHAVSVFIPRNYQEMGHISSGYE
jgi:predicted Rossmann-fold nucleotide-binding protein